MSDVTDKKLKTLSMKSHQYYQLILGTILGASCILYGQNKNLDLPDLPPTPAPRGLGTLQTGESTPIGDELGDVEALNLADPSSLLDLDDRPQAPSQLSKTQVQPGATELATQPLNFKQAALPDPDDDLSNPEPIVAKTPPPAVLEQQPVQVTKTAENQAPLLFPEDEELSQPLALPNTKPVQATVASTVADTKPKEPVKPAPKKTEKKFPFVVAPAFFHGHRNISNEAAEGTSVNKVPPPPTVPAPPIKGVSDISIILSNNQFFPSRVLVKEGNQVRLIFTTVNKKPAALVVEKLQIQRWVAKEDEASVKEELDRSKFETTRELVSSRITEIVIEPKIGIYAFHDVISGASGEINVE